MSFKYGQAIYNAYLKTTGTYIGQVPDEEERSIVWTDGRATLWSTMNIVDEEERQLESRAMSLFHVHAGLAREYDVLGVIPNVWAELSPAMKNYFMDLTRTIGYKADQ